MILYEDDDILVAVKPSGTVSEHTTAGDGFPDILERLLEKQGKRRTVYTVHRLDAPTSGVMVFALNKSAAARLSADFASACADSARSDSAWSDSDHAEKEYLCALCGIPNESCGTLFDLLFYDKRAGKSYVVDRPRKGVREAVLEYRLLDSADTDEMTVTLVATTLKTGRTHQIRAQFASRRLPLYGDRRYGGRGQGVLGLFCRKLTFFHPSGGEKLTFEASPPDSLPWTLFGGGH